MLLCANDSRLFLRTPSGTYPVATVDYADPHLVVTNPSMWSCRSSDVDGVVPPRRPANRPAYPSLQLQQGRRHRRAQARLLRSLPGPLRLRLRQRRLPVPQLAGLPQRDGGPEDELLLVLPEGVRVAAAHAVALRDARKRVLEDGGAAPF
ncbi:hypothetical protein Cni_G27237 [Canna indica]|uniref:Uncharacterized protein n=1 Tax=Canna indica TaxID=4628 RepID=A0AAQ3L3H4_9LILI|nr:hypothetical protein Cni_G27237 [Canna indica]